MAYLIDTNVVSELRKGARCDAHVAAWFETVTPEELYLSVLSVGAAKPPAKIQWPSWRNRSLKASMVFISDEVADDVMWSMTRMMNRLGMVMGDL